MKRETSLRAALTVASTTSGTQTVVKKDDNATRPDHRPQTVTKTAHSGTLDGTERDHSTAKADDGMPDMDRKRRIGRALRAGVALEYGPRN